MSESFLQFLKSLETGDTANALQWVQRIPSNAIDTDVDAAFKCTALHWACRWKNMDVVQALLAKGSSPNSRDKFQATPLHWACQAGDLAIVKLLLQYGSDARTKNALNETPMDTAIAAGHDAIANIWRGQNPSPRPAAVERRDPATLMDSQGYNSKTQATEERREPGAVSPTPDKDTDTASKRSGIAVGVPPNPTRVSATTTNGSTKPQPQQQANGRPQIQHPPAQYPHPPSLPPSAQKPPYQPLSTSTNPGSVLSAGAPMVPGRPDLDASARQRLIAELQTQVIELQKEKLQLEGKLKVHDELQRRIAKIQDERHSTEREMAQRLLNVEMQQRQDRLAHQTTKETLETRHREEMAALRKELRATELRKDELESRVTVIEQRFNATMTAKVNELEEVRKTLENVQAEKARLQVDLFGMNGLKETLASLQHEKAVWEADARAIDELRKDLKRAESIRHQVETELQDSQAQLNEFKKKYDSLTRLNGELTNRVAELSELRQQLITVQRQKVEAELQANAAKDDLQRRKSIQMASVSSTEMAKLEATLQTLRTERATLQTERTDLLAQITQLTDTADSLRRKIAELEEKIAQHDELQTVVQARDRDLVAARSDMVALQAKVDQMRTELEQKIKQSAEHDTELVELRRVATVYSGLQAEVIKAREEVARLTMTEAQLRHALAGVQAEKGTLAEANKTLERAAEERDRVKIALDLDRQELVTKAEEIRQLKYQVEKQRKEHLVEAELLQRNLHEVQTDLAQSEAQRKVLSDGLSAAQAAVKELEETHRSVEERCAEEIMTRLVESRKNETELETEVHRLQAELAEKAVLDSKRTEQEALIVELKVRIKEFQAQLVESENDLTEQENELTQLRNELQQLRAVAATLQNENTDLRRRAALTQKEKDGLKVQVQALQEAATLPVGPRTQPAAVMYDPALKPRAPATSRVAPLPVLVAKPPAAAAVALAPSAAAATMPNSGYLSMNVVHQPGLPTTTSAVPTGFVPKPPATLQQPSMAPPVSVRPYM